MYEPKFYGNLIYKFRTLLAKLIFPCNLERLSLITKTKKKNKKKNKKKKKKIGYNMDILRQNACMVVNFVTRYGW